VAQAVVAVLVLGAGQDAKDADADHLQEGVPREVGIAGVVEGVGEGPSESDALVEPANGLLACVAGQLTGRRLDHERGAEESRTCSHTAGILLDSLFGCGQA
jgi:hypothetical protein